MNDPDGFDDLAREFQRVDLEERGRMLRLLARARRRVAGRWVLAGATAAGLCALALRKLWIDRDAAAVAFAVVQIGLPVVLLVHRWRAQRTLRYAISATTRGFLAFEVARTTAEIRQLGFLFRVAPILVLGILVFHGLLIRQDLIGHALHFSRSPLAALIGFAGPYLILAGVLAHARKKKARLERERTRLEADLAGLSEAASVLPS